jgi:hypothetical protein
MRSVRLTLGSLVLLLVSCSGSSSPSSPDAMTESPPHAGDDAGHPARDAARDVAKGEVGSDAEVSDASDAGVSCSVDGNPGQCITVTACAALAAHSSTPGYCPGPADIECCTLTPNVADNPPTPSGYELMPQADVTPAMTAWAVMILDDPTTYPMFATAMMTFGSLDVLARVEWHPPDFQNSAVHRGVTLYEPI